jgi:hypothetical protein
MAERMSPVNHVSVIWVIVMFWVWDAHRPGALVADEMGLGKTVTLVAEVMICKSLAKKVVMWLPRSICGGIHFRIG